ncbi:MAG: uroporphyrinogen-III synthase [Anaeromyxobacter sp.]|nr:uroporphyrinogen-III synthase [Anaeromyxobacter sp.]MBL0274701.1 uroporphyrinogen-III synthase [Anaeromyxobacter sp.]
MAASLHGRRVAVTRGAGGDDALSARLRALGAEVLECPAIAIGPPEDAAPLDAALGDLAGFDWAVFASVNAVERTVARLDALGLGRLGLEELRLACVGPATAARLAELVREPDLMPTDHTGAALAASLARHVAGQAVLLPRAAEGRPELLEGLSAAGARVTAPVAYRTVAVAPATLAPLGDALAAGRVDAVAFASPSAVKSVVAALGARAPLLGGALLGAIGPTTAAALAEAGFEAGAVAGEHTAEGLAAALLAALAG